MLVSDIIITGVDATVAKFGKLGEEAHAKVYAKVRALSLAVENRAKQKVSGEVLNVRTGQLRSNIQSDTAEGDNGDIVGRIFVTRNVKYAAIHEFGGQTAAHLITPKNALALRFMKGADVVFAKSVNHPGSKIPMRSYMRAALTELKDLILSQLKGVYTAVLGDRSGK